MGRLLYVLERDGLAQSALDLSDPTHLSFDYMRRIGDVLDQLPEGPLRVLHVGGAAMTLPRYLAARRPGSRQVVLEPDADVIEQVRREAPLPARSGIKVRPVDGLAGIAAVREASQDVVILDAFRDGVVPEELTTLAFLTEVVRVLDPAAGAGGVLLANLADQAPFPLVRAVVAGVRDAFGPEATVTLGAEPATLKAKRAGNLVLAAGCSGAVPEAPFGEPSPTEYRVFGGTAVRDSFGGGRAR